MMVEDVFELCGERVGAYSVESVVAEGGFGVVYRAHHSGFKAAVALKCLKIPQHMDEPTRLIFRAQFQDEAELLFKLSAAIPNVVRPLHVDAIVAPNGRFMPYMALEWLEGETLEAFANAHHGKLNDAAWLRELVELLTPAAQALQSAHCFPGPDGPISIVHRDIKPENLFVAQVAGRQMIKVLDFGIGKARSVASQVAGKQSTGGGLTSFSPAYGAPEQWVPRRFGQTGPWTDVWGLALTLVEVLIGRPVLDGDHAAVMGAALDNTRRPTPRNAGAEVTDAVETVFEKALAVDPRHRYRDAGTFWAELRRALELGASRAPKGWHQGPASDQRRAHEELDFGVEPSGPSLELASLPPAARCKAPPPRARPRTVRLAEGDRAQVEKPAHKVGVAKPPGRQASAKFQGVGTATPTGAPVKAVAELPTIEIPSSGPPLWHQCLVPGTAVLCGVLLSVLGQQYAATLGEMFTIGPVKLTWVTIPMVLAGGLALVSRIARRSASR